MSNGFKFVSTDSSEIIAMLISNYERITNRTLHSADPDRLFILWVADAIIQERVKMNVVGNQNIPRYASGEKLDILGEDLYNTVRTEAQPAKCMVEFFISEAQTTSILIPAGTRVTDASQILVWQTKVDSYIPIGETSAVVEVECLTTGTVGNGYIAGQINTLIDIDDVYYYSSCANVTTSDGGTEKLSDQEYYELMRESMNRFGIGSIGSYIYYAKLVSNEIADVCPNVPSDSCVAIYVLMKDGTLASDEIKKTVLASCSADHNRGMTDYVTVEDAECVEYNINFTYYIQSDAVQRASEIAEKVNSAVSEYVAWQHGKFGRDINPDRLRDYLSNTGIKRIVFSEPIFTPLRDGKDNTVPQVASIGTITIVNGGYEDE